MKPEELEALADRIDHEQLWRWAGMDHDKMTPEQKDRMWAGVNLRRYASDRGTVLEALEVGKEFLRGYKLTRCGMGTDSRGCGTNGWHSAINTFANSDHYSRPAGGGSKDWPRMMYRAKMVSDEVPRMILLFEHERTGLATHYKMCGLDPRPATPLPDNHLRCVLGEQCRKCPYLAAIEASPTMSDDAKNEAKAWTCATHILQEKRADNHIEQFLYDKSDDAFDARLAESFGAGYDDGSLDDGN